MTVIFSPGDILKATNLGSRPLTIGYNSRAYKLEPGKPTIIPWEAAVIWFGDPRSAEKAQRVFDDAGNAIGIPPRDSEVNRLRVKYGHQVGSVNDYLKNGGGNDTPVPKVELTTWDDQAITTVLDDPEGESVIPAVSTMADSASQQAMIQNLTRQLEMLKAAVGVQSEGAQSDSSDLPEDDSHLMGDKLKQDPDSMSFTGPDLPDDDDSGPSPFNLNP